MGLLPIATLGGNVNGSARIGFCWFCDGLGVARMTPLPHSFIVLAVIEEAAIRYGDHDL